MKIRLEVAAAGRRFPFEHPGPVVQIGRDPDCELRLDGPAGDAVSRRHARIELRDGHATVSDTGSSNGTLLNDQPVGPPTVLRVGDRVQMGHTGAVLTVLELDLVPEAVVVPEALPPRRNGDAPRRPREQAVAPPAAGLPMPLLLGGAAAAVVVLVVGGLVLMRRNPPDDTAITAADAGSSAKPAVVVPVERSVPAPTAPTAVTPPQVPPVRPKPQPRPPVVKPEVGTYIALDNWVSVLLERAGEENPWAVLRPGARVEVDQELVSLPGYQSLLSLDTGVNLTLWGSLPELSPGSPVLESVVLLHAPADGSHLDFTLDRGRVHLAAKPKDGRPARVHLKFLGEAWDLEFKDADSEVVIQLYGVPFRSDAGKSAPRTYLDLFTKGGLRVQTGRQQLDLADHSQVHWEEAAGTPQSTQLPALPQWWAEPPKNSDPAVLGARRSLLEWSRRLGGAAPPADKADDKKRPAEVVPAIKSDVEDVEDPDNQDLGVLFLAALDEVEPVVDLLRDRREQNAHVRGVALAALQGWLGRNPRHAEGLIRLLEKREGSRAVAERIVGLLHFYTREACGRRATYEGLIDGLAHENLLVRDLSFLQLDRLGAGGWLPKEAAEIKYEPNNPPGKSQDAVRRWRELLAKGMLPRPGAR